MHKIVNDVKILVDSLRNKKTLTVYEKRSLYYINKHLKKIFSDYNVTNIDDSNKKEIIESLEFIRKELYNFGSMYNDIIVLKESNTVEIEFYKRIYRCSEDYIFFPKILEFSPPNITIHTYIRYNKNLFTNRNVVNILDGIRTISKMGYSHRRLSPENIMFENNTKNPIITNFKNITYLGEYSVDLTEDTDFFSINTLEKGHARIQDDIESFGYILIFLHTSRLLNIQEKKYLLKNFKKIKHEKIKKFFELLNKKSINHFDYMKIFI